MNTVRPVSTLIPGSTGRILEVLARTRAELNLTTLAELAGVSPAQTSRIMPHLVNLGVVTRREVPPASLFSMNVDNLAVQPILELLDLPEQLLERLRVDSASIQPPPVNLTLFGSAARGTLQTDSDIDILVVRPQDVDAADEDWSTTLADWCERIRHSTGNPVRVIEVEDGEIPELLGNGEPFWGQIQADGKHIAGRRLEDLSDG